MRKKVYFRLEGYYGWGVGYYTDAKRVEFDNSILALQKELHCAIVMPYEKIGNCMKLRDYWGELYCHPMDLSGFISEYQIEKVENAMHKVGLNLVKVDVYDDIDLDDHHELCKYLIDYIDSGKDIHELKLELEKLACHA